MDGANEEIEIRGELLELLPEKALHWPASRTLLVADTHFGKAATFRQFGIPVPAGTTAAMLQRLAGLIRRTGAERLFVLGDLVHSPVRGKQDFEAELLQWRKSHQSLTIELVPGNHDRGHRELFSQLSLTVKNLPHREPPFLLCHDHEQANDNLLYVLAGHVHPGVRVAVGGKAELRLPCFWFSESFGLLPAYGDFTGCGLINPAHTDGVYAVADGQIVGVQPSGCRAQR